MKRTVHGMFAGFVAIGLWGCIVVAGPRGGEVVVEPPPPPVIVVPARPGVVFVPEFKIYVALDVEYDLFYDGSVWFYFSSGHWYRSKHYNGPWVVVKRGLPRGLVKIPPGQLKKRALELRERGDDDEEEHEERGREKRGRHFEDDD